MQFSTLAVAVVFPGAASAVLVSRLERLTGRLHLTEAMLGLVVTLVADSAKITSAITATARGQGDIRGKGARSRSASALRQLGQPPAYGP